MELKPMIRLEALRTFVEVAGHGNIKDAADKLCRTPSALSMTLKQIEDRLGCALFETDRKASLTAMGRFLYDHSTVLLRDYERAMELVEAQARARSGKLRLASVPSVAAMLLPQVLQGFLAGRPDVEVDLVDTDSTDVRHLVETGQVDLGLAGLSDEAPGLIAGPLFRDPLLVVCREDSPLLRQGEPLGWQDLAAETMILNEATRGLPSPGFQALVAASRFSVRNVTSLIAMVQAGLGVTLLPALATVNLPATLGTRRLADPACLRTVGLYRREGRVLSPVAAAFCADFSQTARRIASQLGLELVG